MGSVGVKSNILEFTNLCFEFPMIIVCSEDTSEHILLVMQKFAKYIHIKVSGLVFMNIFAAHIMQNILSWELYHFKKLLSVSCCELPYDILLRNFQ